MAGWKVFIYTQATWFSVQCDFLAWVEAFLMAFAGVLFIIQTRRTWRRVVWMSVWLTLFLAPCIRLLGSFEGNTIRCHLLPLATGVVRELEHRWRLGLLGPRYVSGLPSHFFLSATVCFLLWLLILISLERLFVTLGKVVRIGRNDSQEKMQFVLRGLSILWGMVTVYIIFLQYSYLDPWHLYDFSGQPIPYFTLTGKRWIVLPLLGALA